MQPSWRRVRTACVSNFPQKSSPTSIQQLQFGFKTQESYATDINENMCAHSNPHMQKASFEWHKYSQVVKGTIIEVKL